MSDIIAALGVLVLPVLVVALVVFAIGAGLMVGAVVGFALASGLWK